VKLGWIQTAKNMSRKSIDYGWHILSSEICTPWQARDIIYFKDPNRPSTDPAFTSSHARDSGTGTPASPPGPSGQTPPGGEDSANLDAQGTEAAKFTTSAPHFSGAVDVSVSLEGEHTIMISVDARDPADKI
jgi:hypothetical protein